MRCPKFEYKGYESEYDVNIETGRVFGKIANIQDVVTFQGESVEEALLEFRVSVDDYLDMLEEENKNELE